MSRHVDFYFDFGSPASYLAWTQLPGIAQVAGAELRLHPILLGGVFQATGNHSPAQIPRKAAWMDRDMARFAARYQVAFVNNPYFPINTMHLMRGAVGYRMRKPEAFDAYVTAVYRGMWAAAANLGDPEVLAQVLQRAGLDPEEFQALIQDPAVKEQLRADTEAAVGRGIFGAPTMFVGGEMYFGQDRLDFVREALQ